MGLCIPIPSGTTTLWRAPGCPRRPSLEACRTQTSVRCSEQGARVCGGVEVWRCGGVTRDVLGKPVTCKDVLSGRVPMKRAFEFNLGSCLAPCPTKQCIAPVSTVPVLIPATNPGLVRDCDPVTDDCTEEHEVGVVPDPQSAALKMLDEMINGTQQGGPPPLTPLTTLPPPLLIPLHTQFEPSELQESHCAHPYAIRHAGIFREFGGVCAWMKTHTGGGNSA